jgi:hypothetical protein
MNEHPAETSRQPASAYLFIDSQDRAQISSLGQEQSLTQFLIKYPVQPLNSFTIQKRQPFLSGYFTRLAVTECRFEFNSPNVNKRNNLIVFFDENNVAHEIEVPEAFYTPDELATALQSALTSAIAGQTWTVAFSGDFFTVNSDADFSIYPAEFSTVDQTLKGLFFMMGFDATLTADPDTTQQGSQFPSMTYTRYIDICSRQLTQYQKVKDNSTRENQVPSVLCRLYLGNYTTEGLGDGGSTATLYYPGCRPCVISRIFNVPKYASWNPGAFIDQIDIELRDDIGNLLYIAGDPNRNEQLNAIRTTNEFQLTLHASES